MKALYSISPFTPQTLYSTPQNSELAVLIGNRLFFLNFFYRERVKKDFHSVIRNRTFNWPYY